MEFMRNFYKIFPEYQEVDVSCFRRFFVTADWDSIFKDIPRRGELCWTIHPILWWAVSDWSIEQHTQTGIRS